MPPNLALSAVIANATHQRSDVPEPEVHAVKTDPAHEEGAGGRIKKSEGAACCASRPGKRRGRPLSDPADAMLTTEERKAKRAASKRLAAQKSYARKQEQAQALTQVSLLLLKEPLSGAALPGAAPELPARR